MWLTPLSIRQTYKMLNKLIAAQLTAEIQPRVFAEQFPDTILYVGDVVPGPVVRWKNASLPDISPPDKRKQTTWLRRVTDLASQQRRKRSRCRMWSATAYSLCS